MATTRKVTSVTCQKIDKKGKALTFSVVVMWNDGNKETKCLPYVTLFDFRSKLSEKYKDPNINIPELPDAKKFERGFLRGTSFEKRKAAVEEFFQKVLWLSEQCSETVKEFFEYRWGEPAASSESRTSQCDSHPPKVPATPTSSNPQNPPAAESADICHYESVDEARQYASICFNPLDPPAEISRSDSVSEPVYWAVYKYDRRKSGEVTLKEGSAVSVMQKELSGWWFVHVQDTNEQGWAPASCLLPEDRKQLTDMTVTGNLGEFLAVCDHVGSGPDELSYKKKDRVEVLEARMDGWWKVRCNGKVGLTPATHLEPAPPKPGKNPANRSSTGSIYHHVTLYRKLSPPPRRNDDDDVEELYAKVNKIHGIPAVPKKPANIDLQTIYEDGAAATAEPTDDSTDIGSSLYAEIPNPIHLQPEDYVGTEVPLDNSIQEVYENVLIQKPATTTTTTTTTTPRYVNVQMDEQGKAITTAADSSPVAGKGPPAAGGTIGRKPPPMSAKPLPAAPAPAPIKKPPAKPAPMPPGGDVEKAKAVMSAATGNGEMPASANPPVTPKSAAKTASAPASAAAVAAGGENRSHGKPLPQVPTAAAGRTISAPTTPPPKCPPTNGVPPSTGKNAVLTPSIVAQNILKGRDKIRVLKVDRGECEKMLTMRGHERDFVLRESSKPGCPYALSVLFSDRIHHFPIVLTAEKKYYIGQYEFATVGEVLGYYRDSALCYTDDGKEVSLGKQLDVNESHLIAGLL